MGLSKDFSCEAGSLSCCRPNPHRHFQSEVCLGCVVCFTPRHLSGLSVRECGAAGSASDQTACPVCPTLGQSWSRHGNASPLRPGAVSAPPSGLDECLFFISLVSDFLAVVFSVSSGCARRRSVSTYAAIVVLQLVYYSR